MKNILVLICLLSLFSCQKKTIQLDTPNYLKFTLDGKNYELNKNVKFEYGGSLCAYSSSALNDSIYIEYEIKGWWLDQYVNCSAFYLFLDGKIYSPFSADSMGNPLPNGVANLNYATEIRKDKNGSTTNYTGTFSASLYQIHQSGWFYVSDGKLLDLSNGTFRTK